MIDLPLIFPAAVLIAFGLGAAITCMFGGLTK